MNNIIVGMGEAYFGIMLPRRKSVVLRQTLAYHVSQCLVLIVVVSCR